MRHEDTGKRVRTSIRWLLSKIRRTKPRKKLLVEVSSEYISIERIFGVTILSTEKQYAEIAPIFVKQR